MGFREDISPDMIINPTSVEYSESIERSPSIKLEGYIKKLPKELDVRNIKIFSISKDGLHQLEDFIEFMTVNHPEIIFKFLVNRKTDG